MASSKGKIEDYCYFSNRNINILIIFISKQSFNSLKHVDNLTKRQKKVEALQELVHIRPDLKGKKVYFFPTLDKYFEGVLLYDAKEKKACIYSVKNDHNYETFSKWITGLKKQGLFKGCKSALTTIFLEPNPASPSIASILCESNYTPYWKTSNCSNCASIQDILLLIQKEILLGGKFVGTVIQEINEGLELQFFNQKKKLEKKIMIFAKGGLLSYEVWVLDQILQEIDLFSPIRIMKRTLNEIDILIQHIISLKVCC